MTKPSKDQVLFIVETHANKIMECLRIDRQSVELFVVGRNSKQFKQYKITGVCGLTVSHNKKHKVYIVWENATSIKDALGTLIHELIHVRLNDFNLPYNKEEDLVRQLENLVLLFI